MSMAIEGIAARTVMPRQNRGRPPTPFLRERILRVATDLFAEKDFDLVPIDEVATRAGVGKGSVYRYFSSKEMLYAEVVVGGFEQLHLELRDAAPTAADWREHAKSIVRHTTRFFWERRGSFGMLRESQALPPVTRRGFSLQHKRLSRLIRAVLAAGVRDGVLRADLDPRVAAEALLGMMRSISRHGRDYSNPDGAAQTVLAIFLEGYAAVS
jgi:TetR/AcrR family transcriptional regulator, cholesterol catabolism regulator